MRRGVTLSSPTHTYTHAQTHTQPQHAATQPHSHTQIRGHEERTDFVRMHRTALAQRPVQGAWHAKQRLCPCAMLPENVGNAVAVWHCRTTCAAEMARNPQAHHVEVSLQCMRAGNSSRRTRLGVSDNFNARADSCSGFGMPPAWSTARSSFTVSSPKRRRFVPDAVAGAGWLLGVAIPPCVAAQAKHAVAAGCWIHR